MYQKITNKISLNDFELLKVLGQGAFGKVILAEHKEKKATYAIKVLSKSNVVESDSVDLTMVERRILELGSHYSFLTGIMWAFQSERNLFYVMEFISGGDLYFHLSYFGRFSRDVTLFYAAELFLAINFLHEHSVVHRDLKLGMI